MTRISERGPEPGLGQLLFRWRSYLPLAVIAGLAFGLYRAGSNPLAGQAAGLEIRHWVGAGLLLAVAGVAIRLYAVGHAPRGTSGRHRRQHAAQLNTFGIYSTLRHPLYLGNILVWCGVSLTSGWPTGALVSAVAGILMFVAIARHEDAYLAERFGSAHEEWAQVTPAFVPRPALWRPSRRPLDWAKAVASEYSTVHSIGATALLFAALRGWRSTGFALPGATWWSLAALNSGLYLGLRLWRARGKRRRAGGTSSNL